jgi:hypothetical protein
MHLPFEITLPLLIKGAGALQLSILIASALVPGQLNWKESLAGLPKLVRQLFWIYGGYTVMAILTLGLFSVIAGDELAAGGKLARMVCAVNAIFWGVRLALQGVLDAKPFLTRWWLTAGYHLLTLLFLGFTVFYAWLAFRHGA